jgi:3-hydroxymyristoyl/3-hydroxydecanoyl-(acyl carrier protein) dehydratase
VLADLVVDGDIARASVPRAHARRLCEGHFPGDPIVPGAFLTELMAEVAAALFAADARLVEIERVAFVARVTPEAPIVVVARRDGPLRARAEIRTRGACAAHAALRFGA